MLDAIKSNLRKFFPIYISGLMLFAVIPAVLSSLPFWESIKEWTELLHPWIQEFLACAAYVKLFFTEAGGLLLLVLLLAVSYFQAHGISAPARRVAEVMGNLGSKCRPCWNRLSKWLAPHTPVFENTECWCQVLLQTGDSLWSETLTELQEGIPVLVHEDHKFVIHAELEDDQAHLTLGNRKVRSLSPGQGVFFDNLYVKFF